MTWRSVYSTGRAKGPAGAKARLAGAYRAVFGGNGSKEDAEMVLADFAAFSGFYQALQPPLTVEQMAYFEGQRAAFGRLFSFLRLSDQEIRALETAARLEAVAHEQEGLL